jgi:hypothetical protein
MAIGYNRAAFPWKLAADKRGLLRGRIDLFSTDRPIDMLARLGVEVRLVVKTQRSKKVA